MKIKDFTVGQIVYVFSDEKVDQLMPQKERKAKKYTVAKVGRKYLYVARGDNADIKTIPQYMLNSFREPEYTDEFLELNVDYGYRSILFPDTRTADEYFEKKELVRLFETKVRWKGYTLSELQEVQRILGV